MAMHRTQILLPKPMLQWLRREAKQRQLSVSEIVRHIIGNAQEATDVSTTRKG